MGEVFDYSQPIAELHVLYSTIRALEPQNKALKRHPLVKRWECDRYSLGVSEYAEITQAMKTELQAMSERLRTRRLAGHGRDPTRIQLSLDLKL